MIAATSTERVQDGRFVLVALQDFWPADSTTAILIKLAETRLRASVTYEEDARKSDDSAYDETNGHKARQKPTCTYKLVGQPYQ